MIILNNIYNLLGIFILTFVGCGLTSARLNILVDKNFINHNQGEFIWTYIPILILFICGIKSLQLLYFIERNQHREIRYTLKRIGHQWYWEYEYRDIKVCSNVFRINSYLLNQNELEKGIFRNLEVDKRIVLPYETQLKLLVTRADVIHSWTVPSLGVKVDAIPGKLNQAFIYSRLPGVFFGQCSEICGALHSGIPICVEFVRFENFWNWIKIQ